MFFKFSYSYSFFLPLLPMGEACLSGRQGARRADEGVYFIQPIFLQEFPSPFADLPYLPILSLLVP